jgi:hypothetical protein
VQPFKALVNGLALNQYTMFWQVDGGQLNAMSDNLNGGAHKEASVDVSGWNWNATKNPPNQYVVNFVAFNSAGAQIAHLSVTVTVLH